MRHVIEHLSTVGKHKIFQISTDESAMLAELRGVFHVVGAPPTVVVHLRYFPFNYLLVFQSCLLILCQ